MGQLTDAQVIATSLYFFPVKARVPLKFGPEVVTSVTCARARVRVVNGRGQTAEGWGETPLSVTWVWPSALSYEERHEALKNLCIVLAQVWAKFGGKGHPIELGHDFQE